MHRLAYLFKPVWVHATLHSCPYRTSFPRALLSLLLSGEGEIIFLGDGRG